MSIPLLTVDEMRQADKMTCQANHMSSKDLMNQAGLAIFETIKNDVSKTDDVHFLILAGPGHNGGDALVVAHHLIRHGYRVTCFMLGSENVHPDVLDIHQTLKDQGVPMLTLTKATLSRFKETLNQASHLVDGLYGSGFKGIIKDVVAEVILMINESEIDVISIDAPSGLDLENGLTKGPCIIANQTIAIAGLKVGHLLQDAMDVTGSIKTVDIGINEDLLNTHRSQLENTQFIQCLHKRKHHSHKYTYGHIMVVGGSKGMMGAPHMALHSALRTGAGLVTGVYRESDYADHIKTVPEIMHAAYQTADQLKTQLKRASVIIFGNGLGKETIDKDITQMILDRQTPLVIDADGIRLIKPYLNDNLGHVVITPHAKELATLLDMSVSALAENPIQSIERLSKQTGMTVLLKGPCSIVTDGIQTSLSTFGHPGLAKAGSGDVLAGIIAARLAMSDHPLKAVEEALYIHGTAASIALVKTSVHAMIATDVIDAIPQALRDMEAKP